MNERRKLTLAACGSACWSAGTSYFRKTYGVPASKGAELIAEPTFGLPYDRRQNALFHQAGLKVVNHFCGGLMPMLDLAVEGGDIMNRHARRHPRQAPLITLNSWNEWTETSYLQPDDLYGYGYLEAVKAVFLSRNRQPNGSAEEETGA